MAIDKELFNSYSNLELEIKDKEKTKTALRKAILAEMQGANVDCIKSELGTFSLVTTKKGEFTEEAQERIDTIAKEVRLVVEPLQIMIDEESKKIKKAEQIEKDNQNFAMVSSNQSFRYLAKKK